MSENNNKLHGKDFLIGAVVGAAVGAITALLVAPKSGKELRQDIAEQARNVSEKTQQIAGTVKDKTQQVVKNVGETASEWAHTAKETALNVVNEVKTFKAARAETAAGEAEQAVIAANSEEQTEEK